MAVIKNNRELDSTILIIGGLVLALVIIVGIFWIHLAKPTDTLITTEMLMFMLGIPTTIISYGAGKKAGENGNGFDIETERKRIREEILTELEEEMQEEQTTN